MAGISVGDERIEVLGLAEFRAKLRALDPAAVKQLRHVQNDAARIVVEAAVPRVPVRTGRAAASIRVASTQAATRVSEGGARAPYMPWLDFGGTILKHTRHPLRRPFERTGRFIWRAFSERREEVLSKLDEGLKAAVRDAGLS